MTEKKDVSTEATAKVEETTDVSADASAEATAKEVTTTEVKDSTAPAAEEKANTDSDPIAVESEDQETKTESTESTDAEPAKEEESEKVEAKTAEEDSDKSKKDDTPQKSSDKTTAKDTKDEKPVPDTNGQPVDLKNFDWAEVDSQIDEYSPEEREKMESLYVDTLSSLSDQEVLDGTIVSISKREVVINVGYKSEAIISISEFRYNPDLKVGDSVEVYVEILEDRLGQLILSHKKARILRAWERVNAALGTDEVIRGFVKCRTKGGLIVDVLGLEAFLPGSQIDVKPVRDYDMYVGKKMDFRVVKINKEFKNVVVSHKALIESELKEQRKEIISKLEKGQVLVGVVKNITSYGVFMDLGGVDGLVHITDLSWGRIAHPEEIVKLDEKLNVVILDFDEGKTRIQLGLKQLTDHPWESMDKKLEPGVRLKGKVVVVADYGAFVEVALGVEGLIHVSEMSWSQHLRSAQDFLKVGDEV
ncbi:MAG: S1 RNA-binding domain-containing protein, partial [Flavobacteriales bacterium]|nr:S1 RNA-binding domain-containing protein [Flavobacteriales bacterium]